MTFSLQHSGGRGIFVILRSKLKRNVHLKILFKTAFKMQFLGGGQRAVGMHDIQCEVLKFNWYS